MSITGLLKLRAGEWVFVREASGRLTPERLDGRPSDERIDRRFVGTDIEEVFVVNGRTEAVLSNRPISGRLTIGELAKADGALVGEYLAQQEARAKAITEKATKTAMKITESIEGTL